MKKKGLLWGIPIGFINGFFASGGHMFQGNIPDVETLRKAQENPDEYPGLIVRVGGYSARFTRLSKELQNEIISRIRQLSLSLPPPR